MKKVTIRINEIDPILQISRPCWLPKDWYKENENPFDWFDEIDKPYLEDTSGRERYTINFDLDFVKFETNPTSNYFYFIHKTPSDFFDNKLFNKYIDDDVISDVKKNKCKIVFYMDDDGDWGENIPYFYNDFTLTVLNSWIESYNLKKEQVYFVSHNCLLKELTDKYKFTPISCCNLEYTSDRLNLNKNQLYVNYSHCDFIVEDSFTYDFNKIEKLFLSYNKNIGPHRFYFMYSLLKNNLINDFLYSFVDNNTDDDCVDRINNYLTDKDKKILDVNIIEKTNNEVGKEILSDKMNYNEFGGEYYGQYLQLEDFEKTFMSVVTESNVGSNTIYFSEKTIKVLLTKHPFILISSPNSLKKLKEYGFKTFDKWWDESYDECEYFIDRIDKVTQVIKSIKNKTKKELIEIRQEMQDILLHNQKLLLKKDGMGWLEEFKNIKF